MLKGISPVLPPELLSILCEMGHGDTLVIADGNFPAASIAKDCKLVRCDGHGVPEILKAILKLVPLDQYVEKPVTLMDVVPGDDCETPIWDTYKELVSEVDDRGADVIGTIDRFPFYDEAKKAYVVIATSERAKYANVILQKGVVIRHLILPGCVDNTKAVIDWVRDHFDDGQVLFSLMRQYVPCGRAGEYPEIDRPLSDEEYDEAEQYLFDSGIEDGFVQEKGSASDAFIPAFDGTGVV